MTSIIAREVGLETEPVALIWSDAKPEDALELKKTAWEVQAHILSSLRALLRDGEEHFGKFLRIGRREGAEGREITGSGKSNTNIIFVKIKEGNHENSRCAIKPKRQKK
jgi:hypothetical protein